MLGVQDFVWLNSEYRILVSDLARFLVTSLATLKPRDVKLKKELPEFQGEVTGCHLLNKPTKFGSHRFRVNVEVRGGVDELLWIAENISRRGRETG